MKMIDYQFEWFESNKRNTPLYLSIDQSGKMHLGTALRQVLPSHIRLGFDTKRKVLAIADGNGAGIRCPRAGVLTVHALSSLIVSAGLKLPIRFHMTLDPSTGFYLGKILPRRQRNSNTKLPQYDIDELLRLYGHVIDQAVYKYAKTMPAAERRAFAVEAFCEAARAYREQYGEMEPYFAKQVRDRLITENKQFTAAAQARSLEQPLRQEDSSFCLYDAIEGDGASGILYVEDRIMLEQFLRTLSPVEQQLCELLRDGSTIEEIKSKFHMDDEDIQNMSLAIGEKRRAFYAVA